MKLYQGTLFKQESGASDGVYESNMKPPDSAAQGNNDMDKPGLSNIVETQEPEYEEQHYAANISGQAYGTRVRKSELDKPNSSAQRKSKTKL